MRKRALDDLHGGFAAVYVARNRLFALQCLVDGKEVRHLVKRVVGQIHNIAVFVVARVGEGDGDDLLVVLTAVEHGDIPDRVAPHERERIEHLGAEHEHVERVAVVAVAAGDEAVVGGVVGRCIQNAVENDQAGLLIQFIFLFAALGDLDHGEKILRLYACGIDVVPDVHGVTSGKIVPRCGGIGLYHEGVRFSTQKAA